MTKKIFIFNWLITSQMELIGKAKGKEEKRFRSQLLIIHFCLFWKRKKHDMSKNSSFSFYFAFHQIERVLTFLTTTTTSIPEKKKIVNCVLLLTEAESESEKVYHRMKHFSFLSRIDLKKTQRKESRRTLFLFFIRY